MAFQARPAPPPPPDLPDYPETLDAQHVAMAAVGEYLYGRYGWQTALARRLHVDPRSIRRWHAGDGPVDRTAWELIKALVIIKAELGRGP